LKNQADVKSLADFEKSGGHEKSCGSKSLANWKIVQKKE
jgi:hypothetical protein